MPHDRRSFLFSLFPSLISLVFPHSRMPQAAEPRTASAKSRPWFTDVASRSSFAYRSNNDFTGRKYFPQPMCGGVAAIDYDNDGYMDLFFTNGAKLPELKKTGSEFFNCLLRNRGDGTFEIGRA